MGCAEHVIKRSKQQLIHGHEKIIVFLLRIQQQAPLEKKSHVSHFVCVPIVHSLKRKRYQLESGEEGGRGKWEEVYFCVEKNGDGQEDR